jgi:hypothetical protein
MRGFACMSSASIQISHDADTSCVLSDALCWRHRASTKQPWWTPPRLAFPLIW